MAESRKSAKKVAENQKKDISMYFYGHAPNWSIVVSRKAGWSGAGNRKMTFWVTENLKLSAENGKLLLQAVESWKPLNPLHINTGFEISQAEWMEKFASLLTTEASLGCQPRALLKKVCFFFQKVFVVFFFIERN